MGDTGLSDNRIVVEPAGLDEFQNVGYGRFESKTAIKTAIMSGNRDLAQTTIWPETQR